MFPLFKKFIERTGVHMDPKVLTQVFEAHNVPAIMIELYDLHDEPIEDNELITKINTLLKPMTDPVKEAENGAITLEATYSDLLAHYCLAMVNLQHVYTHSILKSQQKHDSEPEQEMVILPTEKNLSELSVVDE